MTQPLLRAKDLPPPKDGYREILTAKKQPDVGLNIATLEIEPEESVMLGAADSETAVLALSGTGSLISAGKTLSFSRPDWIETPPTVIHCCAGDSIETTNLGKIPLEVIIVQTPNQHRFPPRYYGDQDIQVDHRGKGILQETSYRLVRLVFDDSNGPPESNMVLGEVVNFPGRWSSYPPHSHPQPEIYYYRFHPKQGYGHGELGEEVFKIHDGDLLVITGNRAHCQVSAPGYHMYYLWAIRHPEKNRYHGFTFEPEHAWTLEEKSKP